MGRQDRKYRVTKLTLAKLIIVLVGEIILQIGKQIVAEAVQVSPIFENRHQGALGPVHLCICNVFYADIRVKVSM